MSFSPTALRAEFPIFEAQGPGFHYLDNAATGQICRAAADALWRFETRTRANVKRGVYRLADAATNAFNDARVAVAAYIGAGHPDEILFTSGCTLAINTAAHALSPRLEPGHEILISELEHHSNIVPWQMAAQRTGARVRAIPVTEEGRLDLERLPDLVSPRTRIIAVSHASNVTGAVADVSALRDAARSVGALLLLDGAQRTPHGPLDVQALGCDLYAFSSHKMFGPTGAGALWVRKDLLADLPPFLGGGEMIRRVGIERSTYAAPPHRFEAGTPPIGPVIGMGAAAAWLATLPWAELARHEMALTEKILDGLDAVPGTRILGPRGTQGRLGVVSFTVDGVHPHDLCQLLDDTHGVALRGGHHCAQPLMDRFDLGATARASLAPYNDQADVDALLEGLDAAIRRLR